MKIAQHLLPWIALLGAAASNGCGAELESPDARDQDSAPAPTPDAATTADADPASLPFVPCPGAVEPGPTGLTGAAVTRQGTAGSIQITVAFCNPLIPEPLDELLFFVTLTDHEGVAPSDLTVGTSATTSATLSTDAFTWDGDDLSLRDHHPKGHLRASIFTTDGTPLLGPDTTYLELTVGGLGGGGSVVVRWEQQYLP